MRKADWEKFLDANEAHVLTLTLDQRNLIADAGQHIDWLESRKRFAEEQAAELLAACEALGAFTRELLKLITHEQIRDAKLTTRMLKVNDQAYNALKKAKGSS